MAAEAWSLILLFRYQDADYEGSSVSVQKLIQNYPGSKEWCGKGLIIMAKNFYAQEDTFQATYILER